MVCQCPYCSNSHSIKCIRFPSYVKYSPLDNTNDTLIACIRHTGLGSYTIDFTTKFDIRPSNMVSSTMHAQRALCKNHKQFKKNPHDHWFLNVDGIDMSIADLERRNVQFTQHTKKICTDDLGECAARLRLYKPVTLKFRGKNTCAEVDHLDTLTKKEVCDKRKRCEPLNEAKNVKMKEESLVVEDDEEEAFGWSTTQEDWTSENLQCFIGLNPESAPKMLRIEQETFPAMSRKKCIPIYECVFEHPVTYIEKKIWISSTIIVSIQQYKDILNQFVSSAMVCEV